MWPIRGHQASPLHSATWPILSLSLSLFFSLSSIVVSFPSSFHRLTFVRDVHASNAREEELLTIRCLKFQLWTLSGGAHAGRQKILLCCHFWQILAPSDLLPWRDLLFLNKLSTIYKTIPTLTDESSPLKSWLLFTLCLPRLFLVNWESFVRWDLLKHHVLSISFHLIYIYIYIDYVLRTFRKYALRDRIINLNVVSIFARANQGSKLKTETTSRFVSMPQT